MGPADDVPAPLRLTVGDSTGRRATTVEVISVYSCELSTPAASVRFIGLLDPFFVLVREGTGVKFRATEIEVSSRYNSELLVRDMVNPDSDTVLLVYTALRAIFDLVGVGVTLIGIVAYVVRRVCDLVCGEVGIKAVVLVFVPSLLAIRVYLHTKQRVRLQYVVDFQLIGVFFR